MRTCGIMYGLSTQDGLWLTVLHFVIRECSSRSLTDHRTKKKTDDPRGPPAARRAKHIAKAILGRVQAVSSGGDPDLDADSYYGS